MKQFFLFSIIAAIATLINITLRYFFSNVLNMNFNISITTAYLAGMVFNFSINKIYNFTSGRRHVIREFRTFFIVSLIGLLLVNIFSLIFLKLFSSIFKEANILETSSHILAVGIVGVYSFFAHKYFTFKDGILEGISKIINIIKRS